MRTLNIILLISFFSICGFSQSTEEIIEKRNIYNEKGDYFFDKHEYKRAVFYYTLAYRKDTTDYFSILKKAEAYTKLKWYPQAEECYNIVFSNPHRRAANIYKLKYALTLYNNNKIKDFKHWLKEYSDIVEEEIKGENLLISSEKRTQLYKDTAIVIMNNNQPDSIKFKIKYQGYKFKRSSGEDEDQLFVVVNNEDEYTLTTSDGQNYVFSFQPMNSYKLVIRKENIRAEGIVDNTKLPKAQKKQKFLNPPPVQQSEVPLEPGMKYEFSSGRQTISAQYMNELKGLAGNYQSADENTVDLTALVKELQLDEDDIYTIRFVKEDDMDTRNRMQISTLTLNERTVNIYGQSFLVVLPERAEENFAIKTNLETLKEEFNPKKYSLKIDDKPIFTEISGDQIMLTVNTKNPASVSAPNQFTAEAISIIPGTEYILSLSKPNAKTGRDDEIFVPLTRGVRYNLTQQLNPSAEFKKALAEFLTDRDEVQLADEEVIDIAILSKELEIKPGEKVSFSLTPIKQPGKSSGVDANVKSTLTIDEEIYQISPGEMYSISIPYQENQMMNIQTDLGYIADNFSPDQYTIMLDTLEFFSEITIDTTGLAARRASGYLSMSVNTESASEVDKADQFTAREVSILPGSEYILTVIKIDAKTKEKDEIIIPLLRDVKYDFTSNPNSQDAFEESMNEFMAGRENIESAEGTLIDITLLSKELQIDEDDEVSFSLLPVKKLTKEPATGSKKVSNLFLDNKVVEFTYIHKYSINIPLSANRTVNMQTNIQHIKDNFDPASINIDIDTISFFSEITIDTTGLGDRIVKDEEITDPVFDVVVVNFDKASYELKPAAKEEILQKVVQQLKKDSRLYVTIKGYTDALGDADYNQRLSKNRAESVKDFVQANGVGENRIRTFSFGESQSLQQGVDWEDLSEEELTKHRKVEIVMYLPE